MAESQSQINRSSGPSPVLRALATIALAGVFVAAFTFIPKPTLAAWMKTVDTFTTEVLRTILSLGGQDAFAFGNRITCRNASLLIGFGCNGVLAYGILASAIVVFVASPTAKLLGLLAGLVFVFVANQLRLVGLVFVAMHLSAKDFEFFHVAVGQVVMLLLIFLFWNSWASRVIPKKPAADDQAVSAPQVD